MLSRLTSHNCGGADIIAEYAVKHYWLVDPEFRTLEIFRLEQGHWFSIGSYAEDVKVRVEPFEAIDVDLQVLWVLD